MRQILNRVTVTGADNSIEPKALLELSKEFPFAEWGILISRNQLNTSRFPGFLWLGQLKDTKFQDKNNVMNLSAHLCGGWLRELTNNSAPEILYNWVSEELCLFSRVQLNWHGQKQKVIQEVFENNLSKLGNKQIIFQIDKVNDGLMTNLPLTINKASLFDTSAGAGIEPKQYPKALKGVYCGYAGGLDPEKLDEQLEKISKVCGDGPIWIDIENNVRSNDDQLFDLAKVRTYLEKASKWVA